MGFRGQDTLSKTDRKFWRPEENATLICARFCIIPGDVKCLEVKRNSVPEGKGSGGKEGLWFRYEAGLAPTRTPDEINSTGSGLTPYSKFERDS